MNAILVDFACKMSAAKTPKESLFKKTVKALVETKNTIDDVAEVARAVQSSPLVHVAARAYTYVATKENGDAICKLVGAERKQPHLQAPIQPLSHAPLAQAAAPERVICQEFKFDPSQDDTALPDESACKICLTNRVRVVCLPCGHACMCMTCGESVSRTRPFVCIICKQTIEQCVRVFL